jgi:hypothetical protein
MESNSAAGGAVEADARSGAGAQESASVSELALGLFILVWERLKGRPDGAAAGTATLPRSVPLVLGVAASTARVTRGMVTAVSRHAAAPASFGAFLVTSLPGMRTLVRALAGAADGLLTRGEDIADRARYRTVVFLRVATTDGRRWTEVELAPQLVEDMVPYLVTETAPKIIDGLLPHLVERVAPPLVDGMVPYLVTEAAPNIIDGLMPHLLATVAPRLVEGLLPEIRERVLPVIIADVARSTAADHRAISVIPRNDAPG